MAWAGIDIGSTFQLRVPSRALQFPETRNWQWRGNQHAVSAEIQGVVCWRGGGCNSITFLVTLAPSLYDHMM